MKTRLIYIFVVLLIGCYNMDREKSNELSKKGIDYYYKATSILVSSDNNTKDDMADSCIYFMAEAIRIDSANKSAYWNKLAFERGLKRLEDAKVTASLYYKKFNDPFGLMSLGGIYHQLGDSVRSKKYFKQALEYYDNAVGNGEVIEDSILIDLSMVNLVNGKIDQSRDYYERYRATPRGQLTFKHIDFDSAKVMFMSEGNVR